MDLNFFGPLFLYQNFFSPVPFGPKILQIQKHFGPNFLVMVEVERKLKWITSKILWPIRDHSKLLLDYFKAVSRLSKTLQDFFKPMLRLLQVMLRDHFKDDFKTTILNSTQLGTTQPQLVFRFFHSTHFCLRTLCFCRGLSFLSFLTF